MNEKQKERARLERQARAINHAKWSNFFFMCLQRGTAKRIARLREEDFKIDPSAAANIPVSSFKDVQSGVIVDKINWPEEDSK